MRPPHPPPSSRETSREPTFLRPACLGNRRTATEFNPSGAEWRVFCPAWARAGQFFLRPLLAANRAPLAPMVVTTHP